jgi:hypothetical protein
VLTSRSCEFIVPPDSQSPKRSAEVWTEEDEELFSRQLEQAKRSSLAPEIALSGPNYTSVPSTSTTVPPEAYGTQENEHDEVYAAGMYENQLLQAASAWIEQPDSPPYEHPRANEGYSDHTNPFRREDERWHR